MTADLHALLQTHFGFSSFRPGQAEVVQAITEGRSAAAIFPTGSGKSLCYQLSALYLPHLTLVVSPLLALMHDQLDFLAQKGIKAASIDSTQSREESVEVMNGVRSGHIKILMISVERLNNERFRHFLRQIPISLLVVDEAHCISEWGHNFRPDYLKLPQYRQEFNIKQTLLLTATATPQVIQDMGQKFGIDSNDITLTGFYRANLNLDVQGVKAEDKITCLSQWLNGRTHQSGIIYVTLQQTAEHVAEQLRQLNIPAQAYHAGMDSERRQSIQQQFMTGELGIIVATIAFGMGIDKSDIRFVAHYDLPKSIENYAQEIGRAGRDGQPSDCLVLANGDNLNVLENFVYGDTPELSAIQYALNDILSSSTQPSGQGTPQWEMVLNSLSNQSNIRPLSLKTLLVYLEIFEIIKPVYSYFAEYKYKFLQSQEEVIARFKGERQAFVKAIVESSDKARTWATVNFERLNQAYPSERSRALTALGYLDEQGMIELQTKQMTQVYDVLNPTVDPSSLAASLFERFRSKEQSEINRIHQLVAFFTSETCLSRQLAAYFADHQLQSDCGHCSVCRGYSASLPPAPNLKPLEQFDFERLSQEIVIKLGDAASTVLISRFLCGLTTPIFTRLKARSLPGFGALEFYRFADVVNWVERQR
ncbi:RecQ family ATP-dependent DNA helicase [Alkalimarinus alittae]|uniref:ATP-dependent DNA helicase RecQ n=1 Tax=Alkalimarinus alittae TaxID=2961619 RepID=A0ABY6N3X5_9ALTE|nr:RecQ family ATP-dependent DNA helicase [Alkalimarinus alittae]UZE96796.1 RecQ family ATP-dependent DNA helicase [Alkalimarinus alittae]